MNLARCLVCLLVITAIAAPAQIIAQEPQNPARAVARHVVADLVTDVASVQPGQVAHLGLRLKLEPRWHVYWLNPGDSGSPTRITVTGPQGVEIEPLDFPLPKFFNQPGDIAGYGYEDEVVFLTRVRVSQEIPPGTTIPIEVSANWLVCREVCIPGKAKLKLDLPVTQATATASRPEVIEAALQRISDRERRQVSAESVGSARVVIDRVGRDLKHVVAFPLPPDALEISNLSSRLEKSRSGETFSVQLSFDHRSLDSNAAAPTVPVLLVLTGSDDVQRGVWVDVALVDNR